MTELEKILKGLECCIDERKCGIDCPYWQDDNNCRANMETDALALLKAQAEELEDLKLCRHKCKIDCLLKSYNELDERYKALKIELLERVKPVPGVWDRGIPLFNCGACGEEIGTKGKAKYCPNCGRVVKWNAES